MVTRNPSDPTRWRTSSNRRSGVHAAVMKRTLSLDLSRSRGVDADAARLGPAFTKNP